MIGFIGTGNMASAIIKGAVESGFLKSEEVGLYNRTPQKAQALCSKYGCTLFESEKEIFNKCNTVVLGVKPGQIGEVHKKSEGADFKGKLIISMAAGKSLEFLEGLFSGGKIVRIMPNINAAVGESVTAFCGNSACTGEDLAFAKNLCEKMGTAVEIAEEQFSAFSAVGGCAPAFCYMFIDALKRAGVKNGLPRDLALSVAVQTVLGSAKMIKESGEHPWELTDRVCSPGGTTIEGVAVLQQMGFESTVTKAVDAAVDKDKLLRNMK